MEAIQLEHGTSERYEELQRGITYYEQFVDNCHSPENKEKWGSYLLALHQEADTERDLLWQ
jgi:hypothetical protein